MLGVSFQLCVHAHPGPWKNLVHADSWCVCYMHTSCLQSKQAEAHWRLRPSTVPVTVTSPIAWWPGFADACNSHAAHVQCGTAGLRVLTDAKHACGVHTCRTGTHTQVQAHRKSAWKQAAQQSTCTAFCVLCVRCELLCAACRSTVRALARYTEEIRSA